jgi:hypothetical protein
MECPICKGIGEIENPKKGVPNNKIMAELLYREGFSIRQIMRFLGYKSPHSVHELLKRDYI